MFWLIWSVGVFVGAVVGFALAAVLAMSAESDRRHEVIGRRLGIRE